MSYQKIMIATDDSEPSRKAAHEGFQLAAQLGAEVAVVYIIDSTKTLGDADAGILPQDQVAKFKREEQKLFEELSAQGYVYEQFSLEDKPSQGVIKAATEWGADLIVIGTHGRTKLKRLFMGSTAENILRHSTVPLLVVPVKTVTG